MAISNHLPIRRRFREIKLESHVSEAPHPEDGPLSGVLPVDVPLYRASIIHSETGVILWTSIPISSYAAAEYLGWRHMADLALSLQDDHEPLPSYLD